MKLSPQSIHSATIDHMFQINLSNSFHIELQPRQILLPARVVLWKIRVSQIPFTIPSLLICRAGEARYRMRYIPLSMLAGVYTLLKYFEEGLTCIGASNKLSVFKAQITNRAWLWFL